MPRLDARPDYALLTRVLRDAGRLSALSPDEFSRAIDVARDARLLGWLLAAVDRHGLPAESPAWLGDRVASTRALVREYERALRWEIDRLDRALLDTGITWVLLKGAAYLAAGLPPGRGRRVADVDVLVPEGDLAGVEAALGGYGWEVAPLDAYDDGYYRNWMHELPPMVHKDRHSVVDVHHAILPRTSRLRPSSARLIERSIAIGGGVRVLCPAHMVLHAAAHLFHDGEVSGALRDLVDLDLLLRHFGHDQNFWRDLVSEAASLELTRPAYYAIRHANRWFDTPVPDGVATEIAAWSPPGAVRRLMDLLVERTIPGRGQRASSSAVFALYVRSHWLRMPPLALARHLTRKALPRGAKS